MYRKTNPEQLYLEDFKLQFGGKLRADNRWVKLSKHMPRELIEEIYARSLSADIGAGAINSRIAFGSIYAKENENWTDRSTLENFLENPYFQYFLGYKEFQMDPPFDASMMVHFRKRFPNEAINEINEAIFKSIALEVEERKNKPKPPSSGGGAVSEDAPAPSSDNPSNTANDSENKCSEPEVATNKGKLILDATCAPADIRYPTDLSLINEARKNTEKIIDILRPPNRAQKRKNGRERKKAHNEFLAIIRQKRPGIRKIRAAIKKQLKYLSANLDLIDELLCKKGFDNLGKKHMERLMTICDLYFQQNMMNINQTNQCEGRIVSLRQPHVRPIVRGKAGKKYEFGQKIALSVLGGYTFTEKQSFDNFNEGITLIDSVKRYKERFGFYPEAVIADQIYRNKENRDFCKLHGIRITGAKLAKPDMPLQEGLDPLEYQDYCERNIVEGRIGTSKRRFGLDLIMCYLPGTALTEGALQVLCMNFSLWLRFLFSLFCLLLESAFPRLQGYFSSPVSSC